MEELDQPGAVQARDGEGVVVREHEVERVVVGLPLTLGGRRGDQALETEAFVRDLRQALDVPVETYDERFTTTLAP